MLRHHRATVWRLCLQHSHGDIERCRDMMQEVCIALWLHFDQLRPDASLQEERSWVCWQCRSALDLLRRKEHLPLQRLPEGAEESLPTDDSATRREDVDELLSAVNDDERCVIQLRLDGYDADEIADVMGVGRNAVYQRIHRAISKMRRLVMILLAVLTITTVAVAVVPQWRQYIFGGKEEEKPVQEEPKTVQEVSPVDSVVTPAPHPKPKPRQRLEPMGHIQEPEPQATEPLPTITEEPIVYVDGNKVVVSGVYGERVTIYSSNGNTLASQMCNGICVFTILPDNNPYGDRLSYKIKIGNRPEIFVSSK